MRLYIKKPVWCEGCSSKSRSLNSRLHVMMPFNVQRSGILAGDTNSLKEKSIKPKKERVKEAAGLVSRVMSLAE
ncbi:hypothetical protein CHARACLAT_010236 [Characodon lateralis]|uniref:Uncharacterized protein n=1 Tax=Characodon lateralis TaxID=208331 RepID=A0ABU7DRU1_9TELE|nr:hypothetical protein [Characodon lateralis]